MYLNDEKEIEKAPFNLSALLMKIAIAVLVIFVIIVITPIPISMVDILLLVTKLSGNSLAIGIILTTIFVRTLGIPVYASGTGLQEKMQKAQPEINALNEKYIGQNDEASNRKKQMEMMAIYKKYNINILGCFLPLLQMPIFFSFYSGLREIANNKSLYPNIDFGFLGIELDMILKSNMTEPILWIIVILAGASMFLFQLLSQMKPKHLTGKKFQNPQAEQQQKTMKIFMYGMNIMLLYFAYSNPVALPLYWIIGNTFSGTQKYISLHMQNKKHQKEMKEMYGDLV